MALVGECDCPKKKKKMMRKEMGSMKTKVKKEMKSTLKKRQKKRRKKRKIQQSEVIPWFQRVVLSQALDGWIEEREQENLKREKGLLVAKEVVPMMKMKMKKGEEMKVTKEVILTMTMTMKMEVEMEMGREAVVEDRSREGLEGPSF